MEWWWYDVEASLKTETARLSTLNSPSSPRIILSASDGAKEFADALFVSKLELPRNLASTGTWSIRKSTVRPISAYAGLSLFFR